MELTTQQVWADMYRLYRSWGMKQGSQPLNNGHNVFNDFFHELEEMVKIHVAQNSSSLPVQFTVTSGTRWLEFYEKMKDAYQNETGLKVGI